MSVKDDDAGGPVRITNREIWEKLDDVAKQVARIADRVENLTEVRDDHETRLRKLETRVTQIVAIGSLLTLVVGPIAGALAGHFL